MVPCPSPAYGSMMIFTSENLSLGQRLRMELRFATSWSLTLGSYAMSTPPCSRLCTTPSLRCCVVYTPQPMGPLPAAFQCGPEFGGVVLYCVKLWLRSIWVASIVGTCWPTFGVTCAGLMSGPVTIADDDDSKTPKLRRSRNPPTRRTPTTRALNQGTARCGARDRAFCLRRSARRSARVLTRSSVSASYLSGDGRPRSLRALSHR